MAAACRRPFFFTVLCGLAIIACGEFVSPTPSEKEEENTQPADTTLIPTLTLSEYMFEVGPEASELTVSFESNTTVTVTPNVAWISVVSTDGNKAKLSIQENDAWAREGTVEFKAISLVSKITVRQQMTDKFGGMDAGLTAVQFREISGDVVNPERGFYYPYEMSSPSYNTITASTVKSKRKQGHTILYMQYILTKYMSKDIPSEWLDNMQKDFDGLREGGAKCVLRFCYKQNESESNKPWDAEEKWVMRHIEQVKPLLQKNEDVIMVFQAGYVGVWGEWYYTDHFIMNPKTYNDYQPRRRVLEAMLDALPTSRQVAVRTPDFKLNMYGIGLKDTLNATTGHDGSILSRIGGFNDCFMSSADDWGTYASSSSRSFWQGDTRYTFMGGETCAVQESPTGNYCDCAPSIRDMERYHWTYLNISYNKNVLNVWKNGGCYDEVKRRLGYRIVVENILHTPTPKAGDPYKLVIYLRNDGFSAFQNPRDAKLVFVADNGSKTTFDLGSDPRTWHPGKHRIETSFTLPASKGTLYLHLADPLLPDRVEYSAALANEGVWDSNTGYNKLLDIK